MLQGFYLTPPSFFFFPCKYKNSIFAISDEFLRGDMLEPGCGTGHRATFVRVITQTVPKRYRISKTTETRINGNSSDIVKKNPEWRIIIRDFFDFPA